MALSNSISLNIRYLYLIVKQENNLLALRIIMEQFQTLPEKSTRTRGSFVSV